MTFNEMLEEVYVHTNRRALVSESTNALKNAARHYHAVENWPRDYVENTYTLPTAGYRFTLAEDTVFPLWRVMGYIRKWDPAGLDPLTGLATGSPGTMFTNIDASTILGAYNEERVNVYWGAGTNLSFVSNTEVDAIKFGYYAWPTLYPAASMNSWFMLKFPELLIVRAALEIFKQVSDKEKIGAFQIMDVANHIEALASFMTSQAK